MATLQELSAALSDQHAHVKELMEAVTASEGTQRESAFEEFSRFLAAHEAAEEEVIHPAAKAQAPGDAAIVEQRLAEESQAGGAMAALEAAGTDAATFGDQFEALRKAVIAHAEAEEHQELPKLEGAVDPDEIGRMQEALARVPEIAASADQDGGRSFAERLQAARAQFQTGDARTM